MIKIARILTTLIMGLIAGPAVSLYGSPTVSPVTAAAWAKEPLPPRFPSSINFFALSQAAPPDVIAIAMNNPVTIVPTSSPPSTTAPSGLIIATAITATNGSNAGTIISRKAAFVTMSTQVPYSGLSCPVRIPGLACNCRRTSRTTAPAALPTASMLNAVKTNGSNPPMKSPMITFGSLRENVNCAKAGLCALSSSTYDPNNTSAANPADAIAYPLVTAFIVVPTASSWSVTTRTSFGKLLITAMPPALSVIGPNESSEIMIPAIDNIDITAIAIP